MVVADPDATLLTACLNGYGKRTPFGPNAAMPEGDLPEDGEPAPAGGDSPGEPEDVERPESPKNRRSSSSFRYRTVSAAAAKASTIGRPPTATAPSSASSRPDDDELMMMTPMAKIDASPSTT